MKDLWGRDMPEEPLAAPPPKWDFGGHADAVGSGPSGETCGSCRHLATFGRSTRAWFKCELARYRWTHGRKTDVLKGDAACSRWAQCKIPGGTDEEGI